MDMDKCTDMVKPSSSLMASRGITRRVTATTTTRTHQSPPCRTWMKCLALVVGLIHQRCRCMGPCQCPPWTLHQRPYWVPQLLRLEPRELPEASLAMALTACSWTQGTWLGVRPWPLAITSSSNSHLNSCNRPNSNPCTRATDRSTCRTRSNIMNSRINSNSNRLRRMCQMARLAQQGLVGHSAQRPRQSPSQFAGVCV